MEAPHEAREPRRDGARQRLLVWRKFDLKKAFTAEQTSGWLGAVKGDTQNLW